MGRGVAQRMRRDGTRAHAPGDRRRTTCVASGLGEQVRARVEKALRESLPDKGFDVVPVGESAEDEELEDVTRLFRVVSGEASTMHYPPLAPGTLSARPEPVDGRAHEASANGPSPRLAP